MFAGVGLALVSLPPSDDAAHGSSRIAENRPTVRSRPSLTAEAWIAIAGSRWPRCVSIAMSAVRAGSRGSMTPRRDRCGRLEWANQRRKRASWSGGRLATASSISSTFMWRGIAQAALRRAYRDRGCVGTGAFGCRYHALFSPSAALVETEAIGISRRQWSTTDEFDLTRPYLLSDIGSRGNERLLKHCTPAASACVDGVTGTEKHFAAMKLDTRVMQLLLSRLRIKRKHLDRRRSNTLFRCRVCLSSCPANQSPRAVGARISCAR